MPKDFPERAALAYAAAAFMLVAGAAVERLLREKLYKISGIRHSKSHFVLRVLKEASVPLV